MHHGYRQVTLVASGTPYMAAGPWLWLLQQFDPVWSAWLSWLEPGGHIAEHIDKGPYRERWQVPVTPAGQLNGQRRQPGIPFRVDQHEWHHVRNDDTTPRVAVVIDRAAILDVPDGPFRLR